MHWLLERHQPPVRMASTLKAAIGATLAISVLSFASDVSHLPWLLAPFGASCVFIFGAPTSSYSQPVNVVGGYVLSAVVGLTFANLLPAVWWAFGPAVGLAIGLMLATRLTHPPAGAVPLIAIAAKTGWSFLFVPILSGSIALVVLATAWHRWTGTAHYPTRS